jgi:ATP-dependent RNA helicase DDX5/DBP2
MVVVFFSSLVLAGPIMLVLAPTRELAVQIKEECDKFGKSSEIKNTVVYGGVKKQTQVHALSQGVEIVIVRLCMTSFSL